MLFAAYSNARRPYAGLPEAPVAFVAMPYETPRDLRRDRASRSRQRSAMSCFGRRISAESPYVSVARVGLLPIPDVAWGDDTRLGGSAITPLTVVEERPRDLECVPIRWEEL